MSGLARKILVEQDSRIRFKMSDFFSSSRDWVARIMAAFFFRQVLRASMM